MRAALFCVGPCTGSAHPGHIGLRGKNTLPQKARKVGRSPRLGHAMAWTSSAGRQTDLSWLSETATASSQAQGTEVSERSCSAIPTAPVPCTTAGN